jgi:hypothetical protein
MISDDMAIELIKEFGAQSRWSGPEERYAERTDRDRLWWNDLYTPSERDYAERDDHEPGEPLLSYLDFGGIARDDSDSCGQSDLIVRSNLRSLTAAYPNVFTSLCYVGSESLGAFLVDLDDGMASMLLGLAHEYALYDDEDMSALESEDIEESWAQWARMHVWGEVNERTQDDWDAIGDERVEQLLWSLIHAAQEGKVPTLGYGSGEEGVHHDGLEVCWDWNLIPLLSAAIQRTAHKLRKRGVIS